jgi:peptidyl-tRNA hydrolase, PTH1 family
MKLLVGLGNPGDGYRGNRHNIGFMALDAIASAHSLGPWKKKFQGYACDGTIDNERVILLKPETYMNESGRAVGEAARFAKLDEADVIVFHDELDLLPGKIRVKVGGGNAGHNGLRSITAHIGNEYKRVRLGIGHPGSKDAVSPYVLSDFAKSERQWLADLLDAIGRAAPYLIKGDDARFLTDVARWTGDAAAEPPERPEPAKAPVARAPHPSGERSNKRQSALAENLRKFLARKKTDTD